MASELQLPWATGRTLYAVIRNSTGSVWRTDTHVFEAYTTANLASYTTTLTEQGTASGYYAGTFPSQITAGTYSVSVYDQAGGSAAEGDTLAGSGNIEWTGSVVEYLADTLTVNVSQWNGSAVSPPNTAGVPKVDMVLVDGNSAISSAGVNFDNLDAAVSSRLAPTVAGRTLDVATTGEAGLDFSNIKDATGAHTLTNITVPTVTSVTNDVGITQAGADKVWSSVARTLTAFAFSVTVGTNNDKSGYSLTQAFPTNFAALAITAGGAVTVGTNQDKTDYALTSAYDPAKTAAQAGDAMTLTAGEENALVTKVWQDLTTGGDFAVANSVGKLLVDDLDAKVSSRSTLDAAGVWAAGTRTLTAFGFGVTVTTNNDKSGYSLSQSFPANFSTLAITVGGAVTVNGAVPVSGTVVLDAAQPNYAPAKAGDPMTLTGAYDAAKTAAQAGNAMALTTAERAALANAILDLPDGVETGFTLRMVQRLLAGVCGGNSTNAGTTYRDLNNTKDRVAGTLDGSNNRTVTSRDLT